MKLSYKILFGSIVILLIYLIVKFITWQYVAYNERRGYCTAEGKFLTEEEKLQNLRADFVAIDLKNWSKDTERNKFSRIQVSKYDLNDKEKIIELIAKADIDKSLQENLGIIAMGSMSEYINRRTCLREPDRCYDFSKSRHGLPSLWKEDNGIDMKYLKSLPKDYSIIIDDDASADVSASVYPLSTIKKIGRNNYQILDFFIYKFCCEHRDIISQAISNSKPNKKTAEEKKRDYKLISELRLDQIDGKSIDNIYISYLYQDLELGQPEQRKKMWLFWSVGSLRRDLQPYLRNISVTACGTIVEIK